MKIKDRCWICEGWTNQDFQFNYPIDNLPFEDPISKICFIHLSCYDYEPLILENANHFNKFSSKGEYSQLINHIEYGKFNLYKITVMFPSNT